MGHVLSLCIPTNGITEWVVPVLESILAQEVDPALYEIVITDNGSNQEFKSIVHQYEKKIENLKYRETAAKGFLNQIESFRLADGELIKFINHRDALLDGALDYLIQYAKTHKEERSPVFFLNGNLNLLPGEHQYDSFDSFVSALSYYSSWSGGLAIWKEDLMQLEGIGKFNALFPHTDLLFLHRSCQSYIIDNTRLVQGIENDSTKKGRYNLFYAFSVEYIRILQSLQEKGNISKKTYEKVKSETAWFIANLYKDFVLYKIPCSYDLNGFKESVGVFYSPMAIKLRAYQLYGKGKATGALKRLLLKNR